MRVYNVKPEDKIIAAILIGATHIPHSEINHENTALNITVKAVLKGHTPKIIAKSSAIREIY